MSYVKLSKKSARALLDLLPSPVYLHGSEQVRAYNELEAGLAPKKRTPAQRRTQAARVSKKAAKGYETDEIRRQVLERAGGKCEAPVCGITVTALSPGQLDHFFGRGKVPQAAENCWQLCRYCHHSKTENRPHAAWWLEEFIAHAELHGYHAEAERAHRRLEGIVAARAASVSRAREGRE